MRRLLIPVVLTLLCVFSAYVWPTRWSYHQTTLYLYDDPGKHDPIVSARVDRFTGRTEVLATNGWIDGAAWVNARHGQ